MRDLYLGDSYDLVKCFWSENLHVIAPLFAHPKFVPEGIRDRFTALTRIPVLDLDSPPDGQFGIFFDPHTGIPREVEALDGATVSHVSLQFIVKVNEKYRPSYMICFDQSCHRRHELNREQQLDAKRSFLRKRGIASFYYISHAPFLFMAAKEEILRAIRNHLIELGIPEEIRGIIRLQGIQSNELED